MGSLDQSHLVTTRTMHFKVLVAVVIIGLVLVDAQDKPQCPRCSDGKPTSCTCPDGSEVEPKRRCVVKVFSRHPALVRTVGCSTFQREAARLADPNVRNVARADQLLAHAPMDQR